MSRDIKVGDDFTFRFQKAAVLDKFKGIFDTVNPHDQTALAEAVCLKTRQGTIELDLPGRRVSIDIKAVRKDARGNVLATVQEFESVPVSATGDDPRLAGLLANMADGTTTPDLITSVRPVVHPLVWPREDKVGDPSGEEGTCRPARIPYLSTVF
jgi:hypothetical protein